jgi:hypothetical protein
MADSGIRYTRARSRKPARMQTGNRTAERRIVRFTVKPSFDDEIIA